MRRKRIPAYAAGLIVVATAAAACSSASSSSSPAATGSASGSASAPATASITIGLPTSVPSFANSDVAVAQAEGYFAKGGLNVKAHNRASGVPVAAGVAGGSLDIAASSAEPVVNAAS